MANSILTLTNPADSGIIFFHSYHSDVMEDQEALVNEPASEGYKLQFVVDEEVTAPFVPPPPVIDVGESEVEILLRYDNALRALVHAGWAADGNYAKGSIIDWCLCFGLLGKMYFDQKRDQLNFSMLRCALFVVAAMGAYIHPPDFGESKMNDFFMGIVGFSAVSNLLCVIAYTMFSVMINRPYAAIDALVARVRNNQIYRAGLLFDCSGMMSLLIAILFARAGAAGSVSEPVSVLLSLLILVTWTWAIIYTDEVQARKVKLFKSKFLDATTGLLNEYAMSKIYRPDDLEAFLTGIGQQHHINSFEGFDLDAVLLMEKADLEDLLSANDPATYSAGGNSQAEQRTGRLVLLTEIRTMHEEILRVQKLRYREE